MNTTAVIGIVVGVIVIIAVVIAVVVALVTVANRKPEPPEQPGRGPTGQHPDPVEGTPSDTSTPHWDRRIDPNEGPQ